MVTPAHVAAGLASLRAARPVYDQAEIYYSGQSKEVFSSAKLRRLLGDTGSRYRANFARTPVDALLERTEISGITSADESAKMYLDEVWTENELGIEAKSIHQLAYEFGDAYLIGMPDDSYATGVSLYAHDPRNVRVFYSAQNPRQKSHAIQRWHEYGDETNGLLSNRLFLRVNVYYADRVEQWASRLPIDNGVGQLLTDAESTAELVPFDEDIPLNFGTVPVFHFRTARPYGRPEHADAYGIQDMINKVLINLMTAIDVAGAPQRYALTDEGLSSLDAFSDPAPSATINENESGFDASPGSVWLLRATKSVGQFPTADTGNFLKPLESLLRQMSLVTDTPMFLFDMGGQTPSGESRRAAEAPLVKKVEDRQASFGVTWREVFAFCLSVAGVRSEAQIAWKPASSLDDLDSWSAAEKQINIGIPMRQVLLERGYDAELLDSWEENAEPEPTPIAPSADEDPVSVAPEPSTF